jgi:pimeloyl-ACP methyl ester carboxylesterase
LALSYARWHNPGAPCLLLIHGGKDHNRNWDRLVADIGGRFDIVAPDLRGHGESEWDNSGAYYLGEFLVDLVALVDHLGWDRFTVIGHSLGSTLATLYTAAYPDKVSRLVAMEGLSLPRKLRRLEAELAAPERLHTYLEASQKSAKRRSREFSSVAEAMARLVEQNPKFPEDMAEHLTIHGLRQLDNGKYRWKCDPMMDQRLRPEISNRERESLWQSIRCPVLLIYGEQSWSDSPEADGTASHFRDLRVVGIAEAGHWLHHDQPQQVSKLIVEFVVETADQ